MPTPQGQTSRKLAWQVLNNLHGSGLTLDRVLDKALSGHAPLSRKDRALVHALVFGVLRWQGRLDWILSHFSKPRLKKIDPPVLNLLRLGIYQIIFLTRIPDAAAVNTAVDLAKTAHPPWVVKFINGVLRAAVRGHNDLVFPSAKSDPVAALSVEKSFAPWLIRRWISRFGVTETAALCDAINGIPPITIRANTLRTDRDRLATQLDGTAQSVTLTPHAPDGIALMGPDRPVFEMEPFTRGDFGVQDEAAQLVSYLAAPAPGQRILDACAGLGGKTGHLAQLMANRGDLVAMDRSADKLFRLQTEMARLGVTCVTTRAHDLNVTADLPPFDRILLDAPCSGLGVLRRNPDGKWVRRPEDISACALRQQKLLSSLAGLVKTGGLLVFAVCSMEPEENEAVIEGFLKHRTAFVLEKAPQALPQPARLLMTPEGYFRTTPHQHGMDGFFAAVLRRISDTPPAQPVSPTPFQSL
ncbi:MAG: 16S rRNA (cytosine(967)-C(5))-methyltransferase RsmB [Desulfobacterales bacterium]|nr:16S rRNA (cytosine(967)-C(5))-methyltransferase RsmB [Desulfobacterales bacterium]